MFLYLKAFFDLDRERPVGFSEGYIPRSKMVEWATDFELEEEQVEMLLFVIPQMDDVVLKRKADKAKQAKDSEPRRLRGRK